VSTGILAKEINMIKPISLCVALVLLLSAGFVAAENIPAYAFHLIRYPGASLTGAFGISNNNVVVGVYIDSQGHQHGFTLSEAEGFSAPIDCPNGTTSLVGINSSGIIVGYYVDSSNNSFAFYYSNGVCNNIPGPPGGSQVAAFGINDDNVISGQYLDPSTGQDAGWIWTLNGSSYTVLPSPQIGEPYSAFDTNVHGTTTVQWQDHIFEDASLYNDNTMTYTTANVPGAVNSYIHAINDFGDTVYTWQDSSGSYQGAVQNGGTFTTFTGPGCSDGTFADGINNNHIIVGACDQSSTVGQGFYVKY
jgi:hypothetical protein